MRTRRPATWVLYRALSSTISPLTAPCFKSPSLNAAALGKHSVRSLGGHTNQSSSASGNPHSPGKTEVTVTACSSHTNTSRERDLCFTLYSNGCTQLPFFANFLLRFNYLQSRVMFPSHHTTWHPFCLLTSSCMPFPPILLGTRLTLSPTPLLP